MTRVRNSPVIYRWTKKLHIYAGLLSFMGLVVWGIAGVGAALLPAPGQRLRPEPEVRYVAFQAPGEATDQQVAERMLEVLDPPFIGRARPQRDAEGRLFMRYFTPNGQRRFILLQGESRIRVEAIPAGPWAFLNSLHVQTFQHSHPALEAKLWGLYNEFSLWAVIFMTLSGVYMWFATRPQLRWAQWTFGAAAAVLVAVYAAVR